MRRDDPIALQGELGVQLIEEALASNYKKSLSAKRLDIDLRSATWISPLGVTSLLCWFYEVSKQRGEICCRLPENESFASTFIETIDFRAAVERLGGKITNIARSHRRFRRNKLAALRSFASESEYKTYCYDLNSEKGQKLLLELDDIPEFISSGRFRNIILSELLDNSFTHAKGINSHYAAFESDTSEKDRSPHPLIASFGSRGYIEVSVADSSSLNLVKTLRKHVPTDYNESVSYQLTRKLRDEVERTILYAFEYASTSNEEGRKNRIKAWLASYEGEPQALATGLYENLALARFYQGQIIIRTAGKLGTIDYSSVDIKNPKPRVFFWNLPRRRKLAFLHGTIVTIRVPINKTPTGKLVRPETPERSIVETTSTAVFPIRMCSILEVAANELQQQEHLLRLEAELIESLRVSSNNCALVVCGLEKSGIPSKVLCAFAELVAHIPRMGKGLLLLVDAQQFEQLQEHWVKVQEKAAQRNSVTSDPALLIMGTSNIVCEAYGSIHHAEATLYKKMAVQLPNGPYVTVDDLLSHIRAIAVKRILKSAPIFHDNGLFLIERRYYLTKFYEVRKILENPFGSFHLAMWLGQRLRALMPNVLIYNVNFLKTLIEHAYSFMPDASSKPLLLDASAHSAASLATEVSSLPNQKPRIVFLCDALVRAMWIQQFLNRYSFPESISIVAVVDGRAGGRGYLSFEGAEKPLQIPVYAPYRTELTPIIQRPLEVPLSEVAIIDQRTHSPTRYPIAERGAENEEAVLKLLDDTSSIRPGHFELGDKHLLYFAPFRRGFQSIRKMLTGWLEREYVDITTTLGVDPSQMPVFVLSEGSGLEEIAAKVLPGMSRVVSLTRDQLQAPPAAASPTSAMWFIMPALATGKTLQQVLDYGRSFKPKYIRVSIVLSRTDPNTVGFYQRISEYSQIETKISFMVTMPLPWFDKSHCQICAARKKLENLITHPAAVARPQLRILLELAHAEIRHEVLTSASSAPTTWDRPKDYPLWKEIYLVSLYAQAQNDMEAKSRLKNELSDERNVELLAAGLGRAFTDKLFSPDGTARSIYKPELLESACKKWVAKQPANPQLFGIQLRGFKLLVPETLRAVSRELFNRITVCAESSKQFGLAAAQDPAFFWEALDTVSDLQGDEFETLRELKDAVRTMAFGIGESGMLTYVKLHRLFLRTTGLGQPFDTLKMNLRCQKQPDAETETLMRMFLQEGFGEAAALFRVLGSTHLYKKHIKLANPQFDQKWQEVIDRVADLKHIWQARPFDLEKVIDALSKVDKARFEMLAAMDLIMCRPGSALERISKQPEILLSSPCSGFKVTVDENCRAVAMHEVHFRGIVQELLSNAAKYGSSDNLKDIEFKLRTVDLPSPMVSIEMLQSLPWQDSTKSEIGLNRIRELVTDYGGLVTFPLRSKTGNCVVQIFLHTWRPE